MTLEVVNNGAEFVVLRLTGALTSANSDSILSRLESLQRQRSVRYYLLDATALELLDSSGIGSLVACRQHLRKQSADLLLAGIKGRARHAMHVARADRIFCMHNDIAEAVAALPQEGTLKWPQPPAAVGPAAARA